MQQGLLVFMKKLCGMDLNIIACFSDGTAKCEMYDVNGA